MKLMLFFTIYSFLYLSICQKYEPCTDRYTQCKLWKEQNLCSLTSYKQYMISTCPVSCDYCKNEPSPMPQPIPNYHDNSTTYNVVNASPTENYPNINHTQMSYNVSLDKNTPETVTSLPQAMKLIQSLTQMISQTANKKNENRNVQLIPETTNKIKNSPNAHKKNSLELKGNRNNNNKGGIIIPYSRREKVDKNNEENEDDELNLNDNTLRMIIQSKKRSHVHPAKNTNNKKKQKVNKQKALINKKKQKSFKANQKTMTHPQQRDEQNPGDDQAPSPSNPTDTTNQPQDETTVETTPAEELTTTSTSTTTPEPISTTAASSTTTQQAQQDTDQSENNGECEGCRHKFSLTLKEPFDVSLKDTTSTKYSILKGNLVQDLGYTLGADVTIGEVSFEKVDRKPDLNSITKAHFTVFGELDKIDDLTNAVNKGNVNGLVVIPNSLKAEQK